MTKLHKQYCPKGHDTYVHGRRKSDSYCILCARESSNKYGINHKEYYRTYRRKQRLKDPNRYHTYTKKELLRWLQWEMRSCNEAQEKEFINDNFWLDIIQDSTEFYRPDSEIGDAEVEATNHSAGAPHSEIAIHDDHSNELHRLKMLEQR